MDAKITKNRLSNFLSYEWLKIVGTIVAVIFFWSILLVTVAARPERGQSFLLFTYSEVTLKDDFNNVMNTASVGGVFSENVVDVSNLEATSGYEGYVLGMRFAMSRGNLLMVSDRTMYSDRVDKETGKYPVVTESYFEEVANTYIGYMGEYNKWLSDCETYLNSFYTGGWENGTIDETTVLTAFRERVLGQKAYRTEKKVLEGLPKEVKRIEKLRSDLIAVYQHIEDGVLSYRNITVDDEGTIYEGAYGLTLHTETLPDLKKFAVICGYDEDGKYFETTDTFTFIIFPWGERKGCEYAQWESLGMINYLIARYSA